MRLLGPASRFSSSLQCIAAGHFQATSRSEKWQLSCLCLEGWEAIQGFRTPRHVCSAIYCL